MSTLLVLACSLAWAGQAPQQRDPPCMMRRPPVPCHPTTTNRCQLLLNDCPPRIFSPPPHCVPQLMAVLPARLTACHPGGCIFCVNSCLEPNPSACLPGLPQPPATFSSGPLNSCFFPAPLLPRTPPFFPAPAAGSSETDCLWDTCSVPKPEQTELLLHPGFL